MNPKTAIYLRISTNNGSQTTDSQLQEIKKYCEMRGWTETEVFEDHVSGGKASRPALDRMMKAMRMGVLARVVCWKLDRLGRSLTHLALVIDEMTHLQIPLVCTSQGINTDSDSPIGKFQLGVLMAVAEFERAIIKERVLAGLSAARNRGVRLGRPSTLNKRRDEVLELKAKGLGVRGIAREIGMPVASVFKLMKEAA
ncbi:MAG TPA: recombinase family protein [Candidatus Paceibacterota bacterium]|nr:recombinase family protein [Verrucomicrobiota bacterium]HSA12276.1 recombinase family protein [Candidatus Paceibacterota bacterium]